MIIGAPFAHTGVDANGTVQVELVAQQSGQMMGEKRLQPHPQTPGRWSALEAPDQLDLRISWLGDLARFREGGGHAREGLEALCPTLYLARGISSIGLSLNCSLYNKLLNVK